MSELDQGPQTYVVTMSASAYRAAQELEARCERLGLDSYHEAGLHLMAAGTPSEKEHWREVWEYIGSAPPGGVGGRARSLLA